MNAPHNESHDLQAEHRAALTAAATTLENPNLAMRIAEYAGAPVNRVLGLLPPVADAGLAKAAEIALQRCLKVAIRTLDEKKQRHPKPWLSSVAAGVTGGVGGFVGVAALPVELPITTTLMLRSVAAIARHSGEDLTQIEARLACLQVFGLGARRSGVRGDVGYFAARTMLTKISGNVASEVARRGALQFSEAAAGSLLSELATRFSLVLSDRLAASALPVIGAIGGATINVIFMNHFQRIAGAHFTVRRLERRYGQALVRHHYAAVAPSAPPVQR
jgi:hypothetical protein